MSTGLDDLISAIDSSVGLPEGDDREDLALDEQYAMSLGADAINKLAACKKNHPKEAI